MTKTDLKVINLTKASRKGSYRVRVSLEGEPGGGPLTLAQLKSLVLGSTVAIEVNGVTITFAARELGHAKKSGEAYRLRNVQVSDGKQSKLAILQLD